MPEENEGSPARGAPWIVDRQTVVLRRRWSIPSTRAAINRAVHEVLRLARRHGCTGDDISDIEIALREALANAVIHGNRSAPDKRVSLRLYGSPDRGLFIAVRDEGEGFDPDNVPDPRSTDRLELPHGRGLFLMRALMDHASHRKGGREVVLWKEKAR